MCYVNLSGIHTSSLCIWVPPLMEGLCYSASNAVRQIELRNGIMFNFYPGLPHLYIPVYVANNLCSHICLVPGTSEFLTPEQYIPKVSFIVPQHAQQLEQKNSLFSEHTYWDLTEYIADIVAREQGGNLKIVSTLHRRSFSSKEDSVSLLTAIEQESTCTPLNQTNVRLSLYQVTYVLKRT